MAPGGAAPLVSRLCRLIVRRARIVHLLGHLLSPQRRTTVKKYAAGKEIKRGFIVIDLSISFE